MKNNIKLNKLKPIFVKKKNGVLGQKLGYDRCPYLSFFVWRLEDKIFNLTGRRDLNTKYTIFDLRCYEMLVKCL